MLNFRNTNITFILLLGLLVRLDIVHHLPWYAYALLFIGYSLIIAYGCYYIGSNFFIKVFCSAKTAQKEIAISFDDGPATSYTPEILQILKAHDISAAFFCIGNRIAGNEALFRSVHEAGHIIGNHSYNHHYLFDLLSSKKMLDELIQTDDAIKRQIGVKPLFFRPPYGVINPNLKKAITKGNYLPIGWSVRSFDTMIKDDAVLLAKVKKAIRPGAIFLFHDTCRSTVNMLPNFIKEVKDRGYNIVPLDKMLNLTAYA